MAERDGGQMVDLNRMCEEAVAWGISSGDRFELERLARANTTPLEEFEPKDHVELEFRGKVAEVLIAAGLVRKANRYLCCSQFGRIIECEGEEHHRFYTLEYCGLRFCPRCGPRTFMRLFAKYAPLLDFVREQRNPRFRLRLITLTSRNVGFLTSAQVKAFNRFVKRALKLLMASVRGWGAIWVNEIGKDNTNLHAHVLIYSPYIEQDKLSQVWQEISGNPVVWISQAGNSGPKALSYLLKYVSKLPSDNPTFLGRLEVAFHKVRRVHTLGLFYNFSGNDTDAELSHWKQCPECGASLKTIDGVLTLQEIARRHLRFIGEVRRERNTPKWVN